LCLLAVPFSHSRLMLKFREESPPTPHTDDPYAVFVASCLKHTLCEATRLQGDL